MQEALYEARRALQTMDVPVGAVVVIDNEIVGRGRNQREASADPLPGLQSICGNPGALRCV